MSNMNPNAMDDLLRLMNIPTAFRLSGIVRTSDGFYLGREDGDTGYNQFIGAPRPVHPGPGHDATLDYWQSMSDERKDAVWLIALFPEDGTPIPLNKDFGVPHLLAVEPAEDDVP